MFGSLGPWLEWIGVAVFALTGALVAADKDMDPFGFALLATVTGVGGGTLRDLLLGIAPVFWVSDPTDILICIAVSVAAFLAGESVQAASRDGARRRVVLIADAIGLCVFAVTGTVRSLVHGASPLVAIVLGVMTATFGGIIRDLLAGDVPLVLRREIYVTAAALAALMVVALDKSGVDPVIGACVAAGVGLTLRLLAILRGWSLPTFRRWIH
ncbi:Uncharacterized membrane protein YeiH [Rhizobiales bacterium GAS191]|jgi:uncharacterized membrane protein YeiH|nr:Uncharacterized membrane protein YeiH [Rhizobiales bacterium GAS188]SED24025.1 Uncharacterized membrane protein YeiH [Rhizobiales bacterium GAS191]